MDRFWGILPIWDNVQLMSPANQLTNWSRGLFWGRFTFISKFIKCYGSCPSPPKQPNINWQMLHPHPVAHMFFIYYGKWMKMAIFCSCLLITHQPVQKTLPSPFLSSIEVLLPKTTKFPDHSGVWCDWTSPIGLADEWPCQNGLHFDLQRLHHFNGNITTNS